MKWIFLFFFTFSLTSCGLRQREMEIDQRAKELNQKEQELNLKEQSLLAKEQQLQEREKQIDSTSSVITDSLIREHQKIPGTWTVEMVCTDTNCPGSAVGDIKNEQWQIKFQDNLVIASAISNKQLVKIYTGSYFGNLLKLAVQQDSSENTANINVRLIQTKETEMEGEREVIQASGCHILYSLKLKKQ